MTSTKLISVFCIALLLSSLLGCGGAENAIDSDNQTSAWLVLPSVKEGNSGQRDYNLQFRLGKGINKDVSISYSVEQLSAEKGVDFDLESGAAFFAKGTTSVTVPFTIYGDIEEEADENFRISLSVPDELSLREDIYIVDIPNDDAPPVLSLTSSLSTSERNENSALTLRVGLSYAYSKPITVVFEYEEGTADSNDFVLVADTITIPPNTLLFDAPILTILADDIDEFDESFTVTATYSDIAKLESNVTTSVLIKDNDPSPSVSFVNFSDEVSEAAGAVDLIVQLDRPSSQVVRANLALSGTAQLGVDYRFDNPLAVEFSPGETQKNLGLTVLSDSVREGGETVVVSLEDLVSAQPGENSKYTLVIASQVSINDTGINRFSDGEYFDYEQPPFGYERQDAAIGRDAEIDSEPFIVVGEGINPKYNGLDGFDFTKLDASGNPLSSAATNWSCIRDNTTGLVFEHKQPDESFAPISETSTKEFLANGLYRSHSFSYTWYETNSKQNGGASGWYLGEKGSPLTVSAPTLSPYCGYQENLFGRTFPLYCSTGSYVNEVNFRGLCGFKDWRLPQVEELRSVVNYQSYQDGIKDHPFDEGFFDCVVGSDTISDCMSSPRSEHYWTATPAANNPDSAWCFNRSSSEFRLCHKAETHHLMLVRSDY